MTTDVVWISPSARAKTAVILMKGHKLSALPVVDAEAVVGLVTQLGLLGAAPDTPVTEVMDSDFVVVGPEATATDAADMLNRTRACCLLVMENERLAGLVTRSDLMPELGKNFDPLTDLPWSDSLREWATRALKHGVEISVVLFDIDKFGLYNKLHGHVVGDAVIQEVASVLKTGTDPEQELVCRYGGDEFGLVTSRLREDAVELADRLKARIGQIKIPDVPESISATYGIFGGRRTKEREDIHYAATIDDLITRASKNCIASKPGREEQVASTAAAPPVLEKAAPAPKPPERLKIKNVTISTTDTEVKAAVVLSQGDRDYSGEAVGYSSSGGTTLRVVAEAAARAASESLANGSVVAVEAVTAHRVGTEDEVVSVAATFIGPRMNARHVGSAIVKRGDQHRTAVAALLSSVNRLIELQEG